MDDLNANEPRAGILSEEIAAMHPGERFQLMFKDELNAGENSSKSMNFPHIKQHLSVSEIIKQYWSGEYNSELLLQHLLKHVMENQNELLEAALKLAEIAKVTPVSGLQAGTIATLCEIIERHRPKPERLEGWLVRHANTTEWVFGDPESAKVKGDNAQDYTVHHLREVVPVEFIRWAPVHSGGTWWISDENSGDLLVVMPCKQTAVDICDAHNAEMERIANA